MTDFCTPFLFPVTLLRGRIDAGCRAPYPQVVEPKGQTGRWLITVVTTLQPRQFLRFPAIITIQHPLTAPTSRHCKSGKWPLVLFRSCFKSRSYSSSLVTESEGSSSRLSSSLASSPPAEAEYHRLRPVTSSVVLRDEHSKHCLRDFSFTSPQLPLISMPLQVIL